VEIGAEALFPEKEYINGIVVAVCLSQSGSLTERQPPSAMIMLRNCTNVNPSFRLNDLAQNLKKIANLLSGSCLEDKHKLLGIIMIIEI
jgi:hypothetical protein